MIVEWELNFEDRKLAENKFTILAHPQKPIEWAIGKNVVFRFMYNKDLDCYECFIPREAMDDFNYTYFDDGEPIQLELF